MSHLDDLGWIDAHVHGAPVAVVWRALPSWSARDWLDRQQAIWKYKLFNPSLGHVFYLGRRPPLYGRETRLRRADPSGYRFALVTDPLAVRGAVIARDRAAHLTLYRFVRGPS